jgi:hypothetical protein
MEFGMIRLNYCNNIQEIIQKCESESEKQELQGTFEKMEKVASMVNDSLAQANLKKNQRNSFAFLEVCLQFRMARVWSESNF